ncbi:YHYH domain-containing protein [Marinobacter sp.]
MVRLFKSFCFASFVFSLPIVSFAHSGGTDENGCHAGSEPYHCHNGSDSSGSSSGADVAIAVGAAVLVVGAIWYYSQCDEDLFRLSHQKGSARGWAPTVEFSGSESGQTTSVGLQYRF